MEVKEIAPFIVGTTMMRLIAMIITIGIKRIGI